MGSKTVLQETLATPKGFRIFTPTYLQTKVVELHWAGYTASEISEIHHVDTDFIDEAIEGFAYVN